MRSFVGCDVEALHGKTESFIHRAAQHPDQFCTVLKRRRRLDANEFLKVCVALDMTPEDVAAYQPRKEADT